MRIRARVVAGMAVLLLGALALLTHTQYAQGEPHARGLAVASVLANADGGHDGENENSNANEHSKAAAVPQVRAEPPPVAPERTGLGYTRRVIFIGDVHGDMQAFHAVLRLAGATDGAECRWRGGDLVAVQVGDQVDRGFEELQVLRCSEQLQHEARAAGGDFVAILGNHELMNAIADFSFVFPEVGWLVGMKK